MNQIEHLKPHLIKLKELLEKPTIEFLLFIFFFLPSSLAVTYYSIDDFQTSVNKILPESASNFLINNVIFITIFALLISYLVSNIHRILSKFTNNHAPTSEVLAALNNAFNILVDAKLKRFNDEYKLRCKQNNVLPDEVFRNITKPDQQIILLTELLYRFFESINPKIEFKVRTYKSENNKVNDLIHFAPAHKEPRTPISLLKKSNSGVSVCLKNKRIIIIEDIVKEAKKMQNNRYIMHNNDDEEVGSLLCFPIYHEPTKCYPYVITVSTNINFFKNNNKKFYEWVFDHFARRIKLEHSLLLLREKTNHASRSE